MSRLFRFSASFLIALLTWQCETPIDFPEAVRAPELGVISEFTAERSLEVRVFEGRYFLEEQPTQYLEDASVTLYRDEVFLEELELDHGQAPPVYVSKTLLLEPNVPYRIRVEADGYEPVMATSRVPSSIPIDKVEVAEVKIDYSPEGDRRRISYNMHLRFDDPSQEVNYYHLNLFQEVWQKRPKEGDMISDAPELRRVAFDPVHDGNQYIAFAQGGLLFDDDRFQGRAFDRAFALEFELDEDEDLGLLFVELRSVSEEYYLYQTSLSLQGNNPGQPIDDGVSIYNNIENGRGIFAGYNLSKLSVAVVP